MYIIARIQVGRIPESVANFDTEEEAKQDNHRRFVQYLNNRDDVNYYNNEDEFRGHFEEIWNRPSTHDNGYEWEGEGYYRIGFLPIEKVYIGENNEIDRWSDFQDIITYEVIDEDQFYGINRR